MRNPEDLILACEEFVAVKNLDSLDKHPFAQKLVSSIAVFKQQLYAVPRLRRLAARVLSMCRGQVLEGSRKWSTDLKNGTAYSRTHQLVGLLLESVKGLAADAQAFGESADYTATFSTGKLRCLSAP